MKLKHYSIRKLKKEILGILAQYLDLEKYQVFFFGSRINGKNSDRSDIDIGIEGKRAIRYEVVAKIKEEISDLPTLYKIDIVDFKRVDKDFYEVAKKDIEIID